MFPGRGFEGDDAVGHSPCSRLDSFLNVPLRHYLRLEAAWQVPLIDRHPLVEEIGWVRGGRDRPS